MQFDRWMKVARRQAGVISRQQCRSTGLTDRQIDRLISRGCLRSTARGVLRVSGAPFLAETPAWIAVLATRSVLIGSFAAYLWGLIPEPPAVIGVAVPPGRLVAAPAGVKVIRTTIPASQSCRRYGLPVTLRPRSAIDHLVGLPLADATAFADRAIAQGWLGTADIADRLERRIPGNSLLRRVLATLQAGAESESERMLHRSLRRAGLTGWVANHPLIVDGRLVARIDVAFPAQRVAIEVDGFAYHSDRSRFQRDRSRQNLLVVRGWTVLRFTWQDLAERPDQVIATIVAALAEAA